MSFSCKKLNPEQLILMTVLLSLAPTSSAYSQGLSNAPAQISCLEKALSGESRPDLPLQHRLESLERSAFGRPSNGALNDRIIQLKKYLGVDESTIANINQPAKRRIEKKNQIKTAQSKKLAIKETAKPKQTENMLSKGNSAAKANNRYQPMAIPTTVELPAKSKAYSAPAELTEKGETEISQNQNKRSKPEADLQSMMTEAISFYQKGKAEQAQKAFEEIVKLYPSCLDAYYNLGSLAERKGEKQAAIRYYEKALNLAPDDAQIQEALSQLAGTKYSATPGSSKSEPGKDANVPNTDTNANSQIASGAGNEGSQQRDFSTNGSAGKQNQNQMQGMPASHSHRLSQSKSRAMQFAVMAGGSVIRYSLRRAISQMR